MTAATTTAHPTTRRRAPRLTPLMPSDAELWSQRERTWRAWADRLGVCHVSFTVRVVARGWHRNTRGVLRTAPCATCQRPTPVRALSLRRVCAECRAASEEDPDVARFRAELARRTQARAA